MASDNLRLIQSQAIEDSHASVLDKGRKLCKSEVDMLNKFISGLPSQLAFFVRAGHKESLREALQSAKIEEAHGYRQTASSTPVTSSVPQLNAAAGSVQSQLDQINKRLDEMTVSPPHQAGGGLQHNTTKGQTQSTTPRVCFRCKGEKHIKTRCNWDG